MLGKFMTKRSWIPNRFAIRRERSCIRTPAFRGMTPKCSRPTSRKKAAQGRVNPWAKAPQSQVVARPGPRGARLGRGETLPDREGGFPQYQRGIFRLGDGRRMWVTQSPRAIPQTAAANMKESYSA